MQPTACLLCHFEIGQSQKQVEGTPFVLLVMENIAYFTSLKRKKSSYLQCCTPLRMLKAGSGK